MFRKLPLLFCITVFNSGCETVIEVNRVFNSTNQEAYDYGICNSGEALRPGEPVRSGCINNKSEEENREAYNFYKNERELYLDGK